MVVITNHHQGVNSYLRRYRPDGFKWPELAADLCGISKMAASSLASDHRFPRAPFCFMIHYRMYRKARREKTTAIALREKHRWKRNNQDPEWRKRHRQQQNAYRKRIGYSKKYRDYHRAYKLKRYHRMKLNPEWKLGLYLRKRMSTALRAQELSPNRTAVILLGCSVAEWRQYLAAKFKPGMTWDNYGRTWHVDHIYPVSKFDLTDEKQRRIAFHFTNTQPLWRRANIRKQASVKNPQLSLAI